MLALCIIGAAATLPSSAFVVVFVDFSASTNAERQVYVDALNKIRDSLQPGDRILVGRIGTSTLTGFVPIVDISLENVPVKRWWDNPGVYENQRAKVVRENRVALDTQWAKVETALRSSATDQTSCILASLPVAAQAFDGDPAQHKEKVVVILSDMLEDCEGHYFEREVPDPRELQKEAQVVSLPSLSGVRVYIAGASAGSNKRFDSIKNFWLAYLAKCNANANAADYGHYLINFDLHASGVAAPAPTKDVGSRLERNCRQALSLGSTKEDVLSGLGTPLDSRNIVPRSEKWLYPHGSFVVFNSKGTVVEFFNSGSFGGCK
jgi:hypothetical protein